MTGFEVGTRGELVILIISVGDGPGFTATAVQMEADDARAMCNSLGSAIKEVAGVSA